MSGMTEAFGCRFYCEEQAILPFEMMVDIWFMLDVVFRWATPPMVPLSVCPSVLVSLCPESRCV